MKLTKKISCLVLAFFLALGVFAVPTTPVQAAAKKATVTSKVRMYMSDKAIADTDATYYRQYNNPITVTFAKKGDKIKNLKTSSKNLVAKQVYTCTYANETPSSYAKIGLIAKKIGTYKVTFDVYNGKNKKSSHTVSVRVDNGPAVVKFAGKQVNGKDGNEYTNKSKGKLSVTMAKGLKLKEISVQYYDKKGNLKTKTVKNNKTINLTDFYTTTKSESNSEDKYNTSSTSLTTTTYIKITYSDTWLDNGRYNQWAAYYIYRHR